MRKKSILVIFGGMSGEHDISLASASFISNALSHCRDYRTLTVGITKEGDWYLYTGPYSRMRNREWLDDAYTKRAALSLDVKEPALIAVSYTHLDVYKRQTDGYRLFTFRTARPRYVRNADTTDTSHGFIWRSRPVDHERNA